MSPAGICGVPSLTLHQSQRVSNVCLLHPLFQYYYSIKDISVGGMCICYGHASSCPWDEEAKVSSSVLWLP